MNVTVVTAWHNATELIPGYMRAVEAGIEHEDRVLIVDNGSVPPLSYRFHERYRDVPWLHVIRSDVNMGFSRASNAGLARAGTDAVLFLNDDVRLKHPGWLAEIKGLLRPGTLVGAEPVSQHHSQVDGTVIPYLDGWCLAGMTEDLLALGGFPEDLEEPSYWSDNMLAARALAEGFRLHAIAPGLHHLSNYTSRRTDVTGLSQRNYQRFAAAVRELGLIPVAA